METMMIPLANSKERPEVLLLVRADNRDQGQYVQSYS